MRMYTLFAVALLSVGAEAAAQQRDSAAFIVRLGTDTIAIERHIRTADRVTIEGVQRSASTMVHRLTMDLDPQGRLTGGEWIVRSPGAAEPVLRRVFAVRGDSAAVTTTQGGTARTVHVAVRDPIILAGPFYTPYEMAMMRAVARPGSTEVTLLAGNAAVSIPLERIGRDSMSLQNQFGEPMRAHVDARGRLLDLHTPAFTTVERLAWVDLPALTREFATRDTTGRGLGPLSPRMAYRTSIGGANIWVDYSRPSARGRSVWGQLVPYGQVWRLGANDATHLATDRTIQLGNLTLQPGTYTLFLLPTADQWTLIVNRGTGMSGLARDSTQDIGRVPMMLETTGTGTEQFTIDVAGDPRGGSLIVAWERARASVPIRVP
jgi:hypothetical protein